jgi:hypothetical protein
LHRGVDRAAPRGTTSPDSDAVWPAEASETSCAVVEEGGVQAGERSNGGPWAEK